MYLKCGFIFNPSAFTQSTPSVILFALGEVCKKLPALLRLPHHSDYMSPPLNSATPQGKTQRKTEPRPIKKRVVNAKHFLVN